MSPHAHLGGAERVTMDLVALHDRAAVEPALIFLAPGPLVEQARALGIEAEVLVAPRLRHVLAARACRRALAARFKAMRADLVHGIMAWGHAFAGPAARRAGIPEVWFQHMVPVRGQGLDLLAALTPTSCVLVNSAFTAAGERRVTPWPRQLEIVRPGVRISSEPLDERRRRGRAALGLGDADFAVGIVARLQRWKGQHVVIQAFATLAHARSRSRLFVIGGPLFGLEPDYPEELQRLAGTLGIADRVVLTGHRDDVPDCLAAMDIAVHASLRPEPFGLALVEAMEAGTPLVAADAGAVREVVTAGLNGLLVPPGDPEILATALLALQHDPGRRSRMAAEGLVTVREHFDAAQVARRVEAIYEAVLARR